MIKVGIIGGAGYTAGELLRILINHPEAEVVYAQSSSNSGNRITDVHKDLIGDTNLEFKSELEYEGLDVIFLCSGHGKSLDFFQNNILPEKLRVIDLSHDFRLKREGNEFVYGLPELNRDLIKKSRYIANPGCFATGIQLAMLPLASKGLINGDIHVSAITGSTGAGQKPSETTHFSWRNNNISAYKIFTHQHNDEIVQSLNQLQPYKNIDLNFIPLRGNFSRGILTTAYTVFDGTLEDAYSIFFNYYDSHYFTHVVNYNPDLKLVVNTNKCILYLEKHDNKLVVISVIDNLVKGASGQAVQNMNLMFGIDERLGLNLKPIAF